MISSSNNSTLRNFNGDGKMDWKDLLILALNYGKDP
jgi:hypothetical protein